MRVCWISGWGNEQAIRGTGAGTGLSLVSGLQPLLNLQSEAGVLAVSREDGFEPCG